MFFYILFAIIITLSVLFAYLINKKHKKNVVENAQKELLIRSEIIAISIEKIFEEHQQILESLSKDTLIINTLQQRKNHTSDYYCPISNIYYHHKNEINRINLINTEGFIFHSHSESNNNFLDLRKTNRFIKAKKSKNITLSRIFKNSEGKFSISMIQPVKYKNNIIGYIEAEILTSFFADVFTKTLNKSNLNFVIVDNNNDIYSSNIELIIGENIEQIIEKHSNDSINKYFKGRKEFIKKRNTEKQGIAVFDNKSKKFGINGRIIAVFDEFYVGNKRFTITITKGYEKTIAATKSFTTNIVSLLILVLFLLMIIILLANKNQKKHIKLQKEANYLREITKSTEQLEEQKSNYEALYNKYKNQNDIILKAKQRLEESNARFELHSDLSFEGIIIHKNGVLIDMNNALEKMFGYERQELIGKNVIALVVPDEYLEKIYSKLKSENNRPYRVEAYKKNGNVILVEIKSRKILYKGEQVRVASIVDISKQREYETEITKYQQKLALHVEQTPFGVIDWNLDFTVNSWNKGAENIFGYSEEEAIGKHVTDLILKGKLKEEITETWKNLAKKKGGNHKVNENNTKTGKLIICDWHNTSLINTSGNVIGVASLVQDITEKQIIKNALIESEFNLKEAQRVGGLGSYSLDFKAGKWTSSKILNDIFGIDDDYNKNIENWLEFVYIDDRQMMIDYFKENILENNELFDKQYRILKNDTKEICWVHGNGELHFDENGNMLRMIGTIRDITKRKNAELEKQKTEQALKESEEKFKTAFKTIPDAVSVINIDSGKYVEINEGFTKLTGYTEKDVLNKPTNQIDIWYKQKDKEKLLSKLRKNGFKNNFEAKFRRKDGTIIYALISARVFKLNNKRYILFVSKNIQDIKDYENKLIVAKEQAEMSDKLKSAFLANMSHEIRTPMNAILGFSNLLSSSGLSDKKRIQFTDIIQSNTEQLLCIINDILDISKIEAGQIEVFKSEFDLIKVLDMLFISFRQKINAKQIEFVKNYTETTFFIKTDENKLKQILINLLNNALKFTHQGSIQIGFKIKKKYIEFFVKDTGIGISKDEQKVIFDRFRQVEITTARKYGGTGLGLSISKAFLNKMGGKIWLESEKEKGSKFYFTIPIEKIALMKIQLILKTKQF